MLNKDEYRQVINQVKKDIEPHIEALLVANEELTREAYHGMLNNINDIVLNIMTTRMPRAGYRDQVNQTKAASWLGIARGTMQSLIKQRDSRND